MKKTAIAAAITILLSLVISGAVPGLATTALAAPGDVIPLQPGFLAALIAAGADTNGSGTITEGEMAALTTLTVMGSAVTDISGIGYATNLTSLSVIGTRITAVPSEISNLTKLTALDLTSNMLTAAGLPDSLWTMSTLTTLDLKLNSISAIPPEFGNLVNLTELNLYDNGLTSLPDEFAGLTKLRELYLHRNSLTALPASIGSLGSLQTLTLWENGITSLPESFGNLTSLTDLDMAHNNLTSLPVTFGNLIGLTRLVLNYNQLTGLPTNVFSGMASLNRLEIEYNYLNPLAGSDDRIELGKVRAGATVVYTRQKDYAVSLNLNGGTLSGSALAKSRYFHGEQVKLPSAIKTGYVFGGWDADGNGTVDAQGGATVVIAPSPVTSSSVVFKAIFGYTVTFRTDRFGTINGGQSDILTHVNAGAHIAAVPEVAPLAGYEFLGWYNGQTKLTEAQILAMDITSNKVFTARYEAAGTIHFTDAGFGAALISAGTDANADGFVTSAELAAVNSLDLSGGTFSSMEGIGGATALQTLKLGTHGLQSLPAELASLTNLQSLDVSGNPLTALPDLSGLGVLTTLDISDCAFSALPDSAILPMSLTLINASGNSISSLPAWLSANTALLSLDLSGNLLTTIPDNFFDGMTALLSLDLSGNYLNPEAPPAGLPGFAVMLPQTTYAITLEFDGGTGDALPKAVFWYGEEIPLPVATRTESIFVGWDMDGDGEADTVGASSASFTPDPPNSATGKTYTAIYISQNPRLAGIGLSAGAYILPEFDPESEGCTVTLYDYVGSVTITPQAASSKAALLIDGEAKQSVNVALATSSESRDVVVNVTAQDGSTTKTYTLHVVRAPFVSLGLTNITVSPAISRSPAFSMSVTAYTGLMPASVGTVTVWATRYSAQATVTIDGVSALSRSVSVGLGLTKTVSIVVTSPLTTDKVRTYTLTLKRATSVSGFTAIPKMGTTPTLSPGGSNRMTFNYSMGGPGTAKIEVYKSSRWVSILTRAESSAGAKTWAWDGKISGSYLPVGTYKARITPIANGITGTAYTITFKIVTYPTVSWNSYAGTFRANGTLYTLCTFKVNYPTNATIQVINSRGKVAAAVKSYVNMPAGRYYAVTWNGKATAGNTAGLTAGALVPIGTYTVRITVGPKYYYKTIKITR